MEQFHFEVDPRLDSYSPVPIEDWNGQVSRFTAQHPSLDQFVFPFLTTWHATVNAMSMPYTMTHAVATSMNAEPTTIWDASLKIKQFAVSLWATQRMGYLSIFNAYENLVVSCLKFAGNFESCRVTDRDFNQKLRETLTPAICDRCWTDSRIVLIREVRNSLSHAGGKETAKLSKQSHDIEAHN